MDKLYKKVIENSSQPYALMKLQYDNSLISKFNLVFQNKAFMNLTHKNCNLGKLIFDYIRNINVNDIIDEDNVLKWTCRGSNLKYIINLSFLDKGHIVINVKDVFPVYDLDDIPKILPINSNLETKCNLEKSEQKYRLLFESMYEGFALHEIVLDENDKPIDYIFLDVNNAFEQITGLNKDDILGKSIMTLFPKTEESWIDSYGKVALTREPLTLENYSVELDKTFLVKAFSPEPYKFAVTFVDVTKLKQLEQTLIEEKELFKTTLFSVGDGVISTDTDGKINIMNNVAESLTGWSQFEAIGKPLESVFKLIDDKTKENISDSFHDILDVKGHISLVSRNNKVTPIENNASPIKCIDGKTQGMVLVFRDVSKTKERIQKIEFLSYHDQLTGLYNRRYFDIALEKLDTKENLPLSIINIDVNGLKLANDAFGHSTGDKLLVQASNILKKPFKEDTLISRLGGDEFAILLPKTTTEQASEFVIKIKDLCNRSKLHPIKVSMAIGWETKNSVDENLNTVFKKSEDHMYKNKLLESQIIKSKTIETVITSLYKKNLLEEEHSHRVGALCEIFGHALNFSECEVKQLNTLGILHDIGKVAIDSNILDKSERLSETEFTEMKRHCEIGYNILSSVNDMSQIASYTLTHHENYDGTGYPKNLKGECIPLHSRIIKIVDAYDAMTQDRPYRKALDRSEAVVELRKHSGTQFDPNLVEIFIKDVIRES